MSMVRKTARKQVRTARRLELMELERRHLLLLQKELEQQEQMLLHRLQELEPKASPSSLVLSSPLPEATERLNQLVMEQLKPKLEKDLRVLDQMVLQPKQE